MKLPEELEELRLQGREEEFSLGLQDRKLELDHTIQPDQEKLLEFDRLLRESISKAQNIALRKYEKLKSLLEEDSDFKNMYCKLYLVPVDDEELEPLMHEFCYLRRPLEVFTYSAGEDKPSLKFTENDIGFSYEFPKVYHGLDLSLGLIYLTEVNNIPLCDIVKFKEFGVEVEIIYETAEQDFRL